MSKTGLLGMADRWVLIQVKKNIWAVSNVGQFDVGQLGYGTSLYQHFGSFQNLPATWVHIYGYIDACKCTEIFRNNLYSRVSKS